MGRIGGNLLISRSILSILSVFSTVHLDCPVGDLVDISAAAVHQALAAGVVVGPEREFALAEEVLVVEAEFFEAGACDIGELEFRLLGGAAGLTAFGNVLDTTAGCLYHLVVSAAEFADKLLAEADGKIEGQLGNLKTFQFAVAAVGWQ